MAAKSIPIIGSHAWPTSTMMRLLLAVGLSVAFVGIRVEGSAVAGATAGKAAKIPVFYSEYKLRSVVENANFEMRQLKRDFTRHLTDIYLRLKTDPAVGLYAARRQPTPLATAGVLLGEEFAELAIKKFVVQRRLLSGMKVAFAKLLPMATIHRLIARYPSFGWLKSESQLDLRPKFPGARENQFVILYTLLELRARVRAADDIVVLTAENIRRILQAAQWYLVESKHGLVDGFELENFSKHAGRIINYYLSEIVEHRSRAANDFERQLGAAKQLIDIVGGRAEFLKFLDKTIDIEALDIDLTTEATNLDLPPTISEEMIQSSQKRWIPDFVLKAVGEDRAHLLERRNEILAFVVPEANKQDADLALWAANVAKYICRNRVYY